MKRDGFDQRINDIWNHPVYQEKYRKLQKLEENREYCRHDVSHFLDVARLMWIYNSEDETGLERDVVYAAALLHDIGRCDELLGGAAHHEGGAKLADGILTDAGFPEEKKAKIVSAIRSHRDRTFAEEKSLRGYLYKADKRSRICFDCKAADTCKWAMEKRNLAVDL